MLRTAAPTPPAEPPDAGRPLRLITGRTVYHFHTRTKTGRTPELAAAAPEVWAELSEADAAAIGVADGDRVRVSTARGAVVAPARVTAIREGVVFVPFHYGYWDAGGDGDGDGGHAERDHDRAANELTPTAWDPVSK
jgi:anaerobic selenocysteine-containing dehydrogenase